METDNIERSGKEEYREVDEVTVEEALGMEVGSTGDSRFLPRFMTSGSQRGEMTISGYLSIEDQGKKIVRLGKLND